MAKKSKKKIRGAKRQAPPEANAPIVAEAVDRLQELAKQLEAASKEAEQISEVVQNGLANDLAGHNLDEAAKKND